MNFEISAYIIQNNERQEEMIMLKGESQVIQRVK